MEGSESASSTQSGKQQVLAVEQQQESDQQQSTTTPNHRNNQEANGSNMNHNNHNNHHQANNHSHVNMNQNGVGSPVEGPPPRLCHLVKWPHFDGYGFNLHAEKSKPGQYIGKVDDNSPALHAGLREGDKIIEVNGVNISNENHKQVVERIKAIPNETKLLVVDEATDRWYKERKLVPKSTQPNVVSIRTPSTDPSLGSTEQTASSLSGSENGSLKGQEAASNGIQMKTSSCDETKDAVPAKRQPEKMSDTNGLVEATQAMKIEQMDNRDGEPAMMEKTAPEPNLSPIIKQSPVTSPSPSEEKAPVPRSPTNSNRSESSNGTASSHNGSQMNMTDRNSSLGSDEFLNLNMTASQMRALIAQRKKRDPKKEQLDLRQKYQIIEQM